MDTQTQVDLLTATVKDLAEDQRSFKTYIVSALDRQADTMDAMRHEMREALGSVNTKLESMDAKIDSVDTRLGAVEVRLDSVDTRLGAVEGGLSSVRSEVSLLTDEVRKNTASIEDMRGWIAHDEAKSFRPRR